MTAPDAIHEPVTKFNQYQKEYQSHKNETELWREGTAQVDDAFLEKIERWRDTLAGNIALRNPSIRNERDRKMKAITQLREQFQDTPSDEQGSQMQVFRKQQTAYLYLHRQDEATH